MTLATHIIAGAAAAKAFSTNPIQAFFIGWISHYILDAILHWDYPLASFESHPDAPLETRVHMNRLNQAFLTDVAKVLVDVGLGFGVVFLLVGHVGQHQLTLILAGALGGVVPDFLQFLYGVSKIRLLGQAQRFHNFIHAGRELKNKPVLGIAFQLCIVLLLAFLLR